MILAKRAVSFASLALSLGAGVGCGDAAPADGAAPVATAETKAEAVAQAASADVAASPTTSAEGAAMPTAALAVATVPEARGSAPRPGASTGGGAPPSRPVASAPTSAVPSPSTAPVPATPRGPAAGKPWQLVASAQASKSLLAAPRLGITYGSRRRGSCPWSRCSRRPSRTAASTPRGRRRRP